MCIVRTQGRDTVGARVPLLHHPAPLPACLPACLCAPPLQELGTGILSNLAAQRETITHARDTLHSADDNISKARKILSNMARRMMQNKLIMMGIIGFLIAAIVLIIYFKAKK